MTVGCGHRKSAVSFDGKIILGKDCCIHVVFIGLHKTAAADESIVRAVFQDDYDLICGANIDSCRVETRNADARQDQTDPAFLIGVHTDPTVRQRTRKRIAACIGNGDGVSANRNTAAGAAALAVAECDAVFGERFFFRIGLAAFGPCFRPDRCQHQGEKEPKRQQKGETAQ